MDVLVDRISDNIWMVYGIFVVGIYLRVEGCDIYVFDFFINFSVGFVIEGGCVGLIVEECILGF